MADMERSRERAIPEFFYTASGEMIPKGLLGIVIDGSFTAQEHLDYCNEQTNANATAKMELDAENAEAEKAHEIEDWEEIEINSNAAIGTNAEQLHTALVAEILIALEPYMTDDEYGFDIDLSELDPGDHGDQVKLEGYLNHAAAGGEEFLELANYAYEIGWSPEDISYNANLLQGAANKVNGDKLVNAISACTLTNMPTTGVFKEAAILLGFTKKALGPLVLPAKIIDITISVKNAFVNKSSYTKPLIQNIRHQYEYNSKDWSKDFRNDYRTRLKERNSWNY